MKKAVNQISLSPSLIARVLGAAAFFLILASTCGQLSKYVLDHDYVKGLVPLFYLNQERNIPTYFSMLLMLLASFLLMGIAALTRKQGFSHFSKWVILSFGFLVLAYDEIFEVHESLTQVTQNILDGNPGGFFRFTWVIPGIAFVLILLLFFRKFLMHLSYKTRFRFLMAGLLFLGGAIGVEMIGARYDELYGAGNLTYSMIATVEESLELAGLVVFIWALLKYYEENYKEVRFKFGR